MSEWHRWVADLYVIGFFYTLGYIAGGDSVRWKDYKDVSFVLVLSVLWPVGWATGFLYDIFYG